MNIKKIIAVTLEKQVKTTEDGITKVWAGTPKSPKQK